MSRLVDDKRRHDSDSITEKMRSEGFFCQKCGTVYTPKIMACRICQPKAYMKLADALEETEDVQPT